jgi:ATP-dependent Clp protease ATP-binding subunit ClpA
MRKSVAPEQIARAVLVLRGHRVLLDAELAALYGVTTKRLNEQVKRNAARRFAQLETRLDKKLTGHDEAIAAILSAIRQLMHPPIPKRRPIGFTADLRKKI